MGLVLTNKSDTVEVTVKTPGGDFKITVGTIPYEIGKKIDDLSVTMLGVIRRIKAGDPLEECSIDSSKLQNEINLLYVKYGIRNFSGLEFADKSAIPCTTKEDENGHTVLSEETFNLFKGNTQFLATASAKLARVKKVGIGKYVSEISDGKDSEEIETAVHGGTAENSPLAKELETSLLNSIMSPTPSKQE